MNYKCPFCKSTNTEVISKPVIPYTMINNGCTPFTSCPYNEYDDSVEYACQDCGQISKIDTHYYKEDKE